MNDADNRPAVAGQVQRPVRRVFGKLQEDGRIPAHTVCPYKQDCEIAEAGQCSHRGELHAVPFSCAVARCFDMTRRA